VLFLADDLAYSWLHRVSHESRLFWASHVGILIVWDRLFGTYVPEGERVRYGLTKDIGTFNPVRAARGLRTRLAVVLRGPGWSPDRPDRG